MYIPVPHDSVKDTVIGVDTLVGALGPLPPLVARNFERNAVLGAQLLQLSHDAVGHDGTACCVEAVHL
jgi:hypothetical protein